MNEQLQTAVAEILNRAISGIDASVDFMQAELPDVIHQLLLWYAVQGVITALTGALILYGCYRLVKKPKAGKSTLVWDYDSHRDTYELGEASPIALFLIIPAFFSLFMVDNIMTSIQIWIAPKIWLMEYAADLVK
ncbi:TMhelix containing protein [Vibrio phage 1.238.A._10N.261.52.F10]|uniref:TMhelix containing protein n=1 Tax=Vibrio phage 1.238.A._10N.261.52.F10 TaxID=1881231 RepID=A0A2I7RUI6_9CAUD|nr:TMhelix containing protein [Vibrio phage 1.238.A._10N.261.52.F10]AUR97315.1 TMhelix containing protein [Vibrio phage 1.238.A._10N.261.52.F10]AUR97409.1 TMhelix containing protein [Vibrio phage 1.238.B._10N.261.52.F10]